MRKMAFPIDPLFINRHSPRAMSGELITDQELMSLFEAARWAPSAFNNQPWRFLYAMRDDAHWQTFFDLLVESNKVWCKNGAALLVIISHNLFEYNNKPSRTHSFDTGAAWQNLALQGTVQNLVVHGIEGFDYEKAREILKIPQEFTLEAMAVIGKPGSPEDLPEKLRAQEEPNDRKSVAQIIANGAYANRLADK